MGCNSVKMLLTLLFYGVLTQMDTNDICFKGAVSRNSAKLGNYKMPVKNYRLKLYRKVKIT